MYTHKILPQSEEKKWNKRNSLYTWTAWPLQLLNNELSSNGIKNETNLISADTLHWPEEKKHISKNETDVLNKFNTHIKYAAAHFKHTQSQMRKKHQPEHNSFTHRGKKTLPEVTNETDKRLYLHTQFSDCDLITSIELLIFACSTDCVAQQLFFYSFFLICATNWEFFFKTDMFVRDSVLK